jgi:hypothetical protein
MIRKKGQCHEDGKLRNVEYDKKIPKWTRKVPWSMGNTKNACKIIPGNPKRRDYLESVEDHENIVL